jgi:competence protein ComEA
MAEPTWARIRFASASIAALFLCVLVATQATKCAAQSAAPQSSSKPKPAPRPEARVDINHASVAELLKVPGMTPSWAGRIIRFRPYRTKQDLVDRGVLPSDVYDRIKDNVIAHRNEQ